VTRLLIVLVLCLLVCGAGCVDLVGDGSGPPEDDSSPRTGQADEPTGPADDSTGASEPAGPADDSTSTGDTEGAGTDDGDDEDDPGTGEDDPGTDDPDEGQAYTVTVTDVVDGDTIDVAYRNGSTDTVRLLGVDTPEVNSSVAPGWYEGVPDTPAARDCLRAVGERASSYVRERLAGETVTLRLDTAADRWGLYGRLLGYVVHEGSTLNHDLLGEGYARLFDSTFGQRERFDEAERGARTDGTGVWSCRSVGEG
jgi:micrococcal nuclease